MKKILNLSLVALLVFALSSCKNEGSPEAVAEKYLDCLSKADFEGAKLFSTKESATLLDMLSMMSQGTDLDELAMIKVEYKNVKCVVDGKTAVYTCDSHITKDGEEPVINENTLDLVNVDGKWLVKQEKEDGDDMFDFEGDDMDFDDDSDYYDLDEGEEIDGDAISEDNE